MSFPASSGRARAGRTPHCDLIVATRNRGKAREIREALKGLGLRILSLSDFADVPDVEENGKTFVENALKKARFYSNYFGTLTLADDSGLEVDFLKGLPGIYSARYAGERKSTQENNQKLLREMEGVPISTRGARFKCVIAVVSPDGTEILAEDSCKGRIGFEEKGRKGFGYDPLFFLPNYKKTMAELPLKEKNRISHRGKALRKIRAKLRLLLGSEKLSDG